MIDNFEAILFLLTSLSLLVCAIWLMSRGITSQYVDPGEPWHPMVNGGPNSKEFKKYMKTVTKRVHPEMVDVEPGEKLMGVTFEKKDSCDLEEYKALQQRIEDLRAELEDDDEDDDGDIIVRV
tara:strand:+ start:2910 stop:3278 length:369 start_codon:yes stop_codon:yes gene_type:complete